MDPDSIPKPVPPSPSLPKTIGTLNILFAIVLLLCGGGCLRGVTVALKGNPSLRLEPKATQDVANEMRRGFVSELSTKEAQASNEAEKERLRAERERIEERPQTVQTAVDFPKVNRGTRRLAIYLWADVVSAPILNLLMLIAGVGLVRLKAWGRALGVWVAALKLVRLAALGLFLLAFVLPLLNQGLDQLTPTDFVEVPFSKMREDQRGPRGAGPPVIQKPEEYMKALKTMGYVGAVLYATFGAIYPLIALLVLTRPAAKAACEPPRDAEGFQEPILE